MQAWYVARSMTQRFTLRAICASVAPDVAHELLGRRRAHRVVADRPLAATGLPQPFDAAPPPVDRATEVPPRQRHQGTASEAPPAASSLDVLRNVTRRRSASRTRFSRARDPLAGPDRAHHLRDG